MYVRIRMKDLFERFERRMRVLKETNRLKLFANGFINFLKNILIYPLRNTRLWNYC